MNVLFVSLIDFSSLEERGIYTDLLREFRSHGHKIYAVSPTGRDVTGYDLIEDENAVILKIHLSNLQKTANYIKKGITSIALGPMLKRAIKKYFSDVKFDLILYPTPQITMHSAVRYVKERDHAFSYLMLKDIFPQGAVDLGALSETGVRGVAYRYFRRLEKKFYQISDWIGCMSPRNIDYIIRNNPDIDPAKVELCPNSIEVRDVVLDAADRNEIREKYELPLGKTIYVYGGNLGKPQGIPFIIECLKALRNDPQAFFLIVGSGTEYELLETYIQEEKPPNVRLMRSLPRDDYDLMIASCDVGLVFISHILKTPGIPSRLLSYLQAQLPVIACTDPVTDVGKIIVDGGFGWWCESNDAANFVKIVDEAGNADLPKLGMKGFEYLKQHYTVAEGYRIIAGHCSISGVD